MKKCILHFMILAFFSYSCKKEILSDQHLNSKTGKNSAVIKSTFLLPTGDEVVPVTLPSGLEPGNYQLMFADNFNVDHIGGQNDDVNTFWWRARDGQQTQPSNGFVSRDDPDNISLANSVLNLKYSFDSSQGTETTGGLAGAGIISRFKFGYGYYETKVKLFTGAHGFHQSFWQTAGGAFDINAFEFDSRVFKTNNPLYPNIWRYLTPKTQTQVPESSPLIIPSPTHTSARDNSQSAWFTFGYEWTPGKVKLFKDGQLIFTMDSLSMKDDENPMINMLGLYTPGEVWITGKPYKIYQYNPEAPLDENYSKMQVGYFAYYAKPMNNVNLVGDASFEYRVVPTDSLRSAGWVFQSGLRDPVPVNNTIPRVTGRAYLKNIGTDAYDGNNVLMEKADQAMTHQRINYIANGTYTLKAYIKCSSYSTKPLTDHPTFEVYDVNNDTLLSTFSSGVAGVARRHIQYAHSNWVEISIPNISVVNKGATIVIRSNGAATDWLMVDKVSFTLQ